MCSLLGGFSGYAPPHFVSQGLAVVVLLQKSAAVFGFTSSGMVVRGLRCMQVVKAKRYVWK